VFVVRIVPLYSFIMSCSLIYARRFDRAIEVNQIAEVFSRSQLH
jgi:hypothetical protein